MTLSSPSRRNVLKGAVALAAALSPGRILAQQSEVHEVTIRAFKFAPKVVQVRVGDTIRWTNKDLAPHTATADAFGWDTGTLEKNESQEIVVTADMEKTYFCAFHPHMKGKIEVVLG